MNKMRCGYHIQFLLLLSILQIFSAVGLVYAKETASASGAGTAAGDTKKKSVVYRPPRRGAPLTRVGGASRGSGSSLPSLYVLAPEQTGLTLQAQPTLYWYASSPVDAQFEFALIADDDKQILVERNLAAVNSAGIHGVSLKEMGIVLKQGVPYQWSVAIVIDRENRSGDLFASGTIERVSSAEFVQQEYTGEDRVSRYAEAGLWYDALDMAARLIKEHPEERRFTEQRALLLEQVRLDEVAAYERGAAGR